MTTTASEWRLRGVLLFMAGMLIIALLVVPPPVPSWLRYMDVVIAGLLALFALCPWEELS